MSDRQKRIAVVTVHGTGDTAPGPEGEKWFQVGSGFTQRLKARLQQQGLEADVLPHLWTGANSSQARSHAADKLADAVKHHAKHYDGVHVIGHSHGGNVANDAADFLRWGRRKGRERITSMTTVGTPFFNSRTGFIKTFTGWAFIAITVLSTLVMAPAVLIYAVGAIALVAEGNFGPTEIGISLGLGAVLLLAYWFMWSLAIQTKRKITRPRKPAANAAVEVLSIWHPNDEAIAFLQRVESFPLEPFPKGSWSRGARMPGIHWGVNGVLLSVAAAAVLMVLLGLSAAQVELAIVKDPALRGTIQSLGIVALVLAVPLAPIVFYAFYALRRFFIGISTDWTLRNVANRGIAGALRGMAFGRDDDEVLCQVATRSHTHRTREVKLEGELAARLQNGAAKAAGELIEKYRWSLFTVGADSNSPLTSLAVDAMTWDSLIHTTYFDQPEIADVIADHIAEAQRGEAAAPVASAAAVAA